VESTELLSSRQPQRGLFDDYELTDLEAINVGEERFVGHWFDTWVPIEISRYERFKTVELPKIIRRDQSFM
jgi:hypothetical protein